MYALALGLMRKPLCDVYGFVRRLVCAFPNVKDGFCTKHVLWSRVSVEEVRGCSGNRRSPLERSNLM